MESPSTARVDGGAHAASFGRDRRAAIAAGVVFPISPFGWARILLRVLLLVVMAAIFVLSHGICRLFGIEPRGTRRIFRAGCRIVGARVVHSGAPRGDDVFYIANHLSWVDILALGGTCGTSFVAKAELARAPVVGWLATLHRSVYVRREDRLGIVHQIERLRTSIGNRWRIAVFPEGTTTDGRSLLPFKTPLLRVLEPAPPGVMVQPVLLDYGSASEEVAWIGDETGLDHAKRLLARPGSFILRVHFLEPFDPGHFPGRKAIAAESRRRIEEALVATLGRPLRPFAWAVPPVRYAPLPTGEEG